MVAATTTAINDNARNNLIAFDKDQQIQVVPPSNHCSFSVAVFGPTGWQMVVVNGFEFISSFTVTSVSGRCQRN